MSQQDNGSAGLCGDPAVELPEIVKTFSPAMAFGKEAKFISIAGGSSVSAQIRGIDCVAFCRECLCKPTIPSGMLGQAVDNLHCRFRLGVFSIHFGKPAINKDLCSVVCCESKCRFTHARLL